jgi:hypothetical protein
LSAVANEQCDLRVRVTFGVGYTFMGECHCNMANEAKSRAGGLEQSAWDGVA